MEEATEEALSGGFVAAAVRVGDTVRKRPPRDPEFVHGLLLFFERSGWRGAPRFLGSDDSGRDVLEFLDGTVPWQRAPDSGLAAVGRLIREFHDLTAGTPSAGDQEVVCHHDLSPKNTVYRGTEPVAFIDWDDAAPGRRVQDVAHACWQFARLGPDATDAGPKIRAIADGYELNAADRAVLVDTILWWQDATWRGILAGADAGDPAMVRLRDDGIVDQIRAAYEWTSRHRAELEPGSPKVLS
ncbi:hypothetical protein Q0Z83_052030 [Actinoplanes sichuanensis]|uniref:Phosphotransferase n=1 Tax=Actinoplanes sichuanensis TaxID=512349 RepID=A0ABW4ATT4_9ACTN|nr:phosphotransferase [Actinoplanes sichuanensis]BEL07012.1 hypothetical protein Q0Z83_052030 [Actinoplanes sichuanensis]